MLIFPLRRESFPECADGNQPIRFSFSAFSLSEKRFRERYFFDSISKVERVPTVFPQKSLIIFSFRRQVVKPEKSVEYRVRKFFQKNFSLKPQKSVEYRVRGLSLKKVPTEGLSNPKKVWNTG